MHWTFIWWWTQSVFVKSLFRDSFDGIRASPSLLLDFSRCSSKICFYMKKCRISPGFWVCYCLFSLLVGLCIWLVFVLSWSSFLIGVWGLKTVTCMLSPLGGAAENPFPLPALVQIFLISSNAKVGNWTKLLMKWDFRWPPRRIERIRCKPLNTSLQSCDSGEGRASWADSLVFGVWGVHLDQEKSFWNGWIFRIATILHPLFCCKIWHPCIKGPPGPSDKYTSRPRERIFGTISGIWKRTLAPPRIDLIKSKGNRHSNEILFCLWTSHSCGLSLGQFERSFWRNLLTRSAFSGPVWPVGGGGSSPWYMGGY